jgi:hypothetical protein
MPIELALLSSSLTNCLKVCWWYATNLGFQHDKQKKGRLLGAVKVIRLLFSPAGFKHREISIQYWLRSGVVVQKVGVDDTDQVLSVEVRNSTPVK